MILVVLIQNASSIVDGDFTVVSCALFAPLFIELFEQQWSYVAIKRLNEHREGEGQ